jgi:hypothetical protein
MSNVDAARRAMAYGMQRGVERRRPASRAAASPSTADMRKRTPEAIRRSHPLAGAFVEALQSEAAALRLQLNVRTKRTQP